MWILCRVTWLAADQVGFFITQITVVNQLLNAGALACQSDSVIISRLAVGTEINRMLMVADLCQHLFETQNAIIGSGRTLAKCR